LEFFSEDIFLNSIGIGRHRQAAALHGLQRYTESIAAYQTALELEPGSSQVLRALAETAADRTLSVFFLGQKVHHFSFVLSSRIFVHKKLSQICNPKINLFLIVPYF